jgi:kynurenine formamidase
MCVMRANTVIGTIGLVVVASSGIAAAGQRGGQQAAGAANQSTVTKAQFDEWMVKLSNWGRWGKDDERGALNNITPQKVRQAAALARSGVTVSLSHQLARATPKPAPEPRPIDRAGAATSRFLIDGDYLFERQEIEYHGSRVSHFDALCHVSYNGQVYNGLTFKEIVTNDGGCSKLSVNSAKDGIVTRGVLLDLPGTRVRPADILAWEKKTGVRISAGDALLLRTRKAGAAPAFGSAGYDPELIPFFKERDIALLGSDTAQEGGSIPGVAIPIHVFTLVGLGMNLLDNLALEELAATADTLKRWEFMLVINPLRMEKGAGSPVNPVAIF